MIITIDGPAGTGKTTVAKRVAEQLGFLYFDTGAMYRALTYRLLQEKISFKDEKRIQEVLNPFEFTIQRGPQIRYFVNGKDLTNEIRLPEVTKNVSEVAALGPVREALVSIQRQFGKEGNAVFDGRDMGTVVFPQADYKFFLTARPSVRAERRYLEVKDKIQGADRERVLVEIMERDLFDSSRDISPLKQAQDAVLVDTSDLSIDEVVKKILEHINKRKK